MVSRRRGGRGGGASSNTPQVVTRPLLWRQRLPDVDTARSIASDPRRPGRAPLMRPPVSRVAPDETLDKFGIHLAFGHFKEIFVGSGASKREC